MSDLTDRRALVTGASRGIGRAIAEAYGEAGASVALTARSTADLEAVADGIDAETLVVPGDLTDAGDVEAVVDRTVEAFGGLDVLVNNAAALVRANLDETSDAEIDQLLEVNLAGLMRVTREALPALREADGTVVNVSSVAAEVGTDGLSAYSATKGGVSALTRQLATAYADDGVRVNAIAPGTIKTEINEQARQDPEWVRSREEQIPLGRLGEPADVADPAVFLASEDARYVTGHVLVVDGGIVASA